VRGALTHWVIGHPALATGLRDWPGTLSLVLVAGGGIAAVAGLALRRRALRDDLDAGTALVVVMALATPVGEALASAVGTNMLTTRNLAVSWPWLALVVGAVLTRAGRFKVAAVVLVVSGWAVAAATMLERRSARPDFDGAAAFIERSAHPQDTVVDGAVLLLTPGPLSGLDAALGGGHRIVRAGAPEVRDRNFRAGDQIASPEAVMRRAAASRGRIFVLVPDEPSGAARAWDGPAKASGEPYRRVEARRFPGVLPLSVLVYARD
jgi:hypothetical protein